jgi:pyrimidine/purine-5'-nucleotide nucleosidase
LAAEPVTTRIYPAGMLYTLSRNEVERLQDASRGNLAGLVRRCALAVLNSGNESDDAEALIEQHRDFSIEVQQVNRGLRIELTNAPGSAFVDGRIIEGIRELLSAVIRDLVYYDTEISGHPHIDLASSKGITNAVFELLRNAGTLVPEVEPNLVVCWGGHSIGRSEYEYTKDCGYELGLLPEHRDRLRAGRHEGADERRHHRARQAAGEIGALHRRVRAGHHRRGIA